MQKFLKQIKALQIRQNVVIALRFALLLWMLMLIVFIMFFSVHTIHYLKLASIPPMALFFFALTLKIMLALLTLYLVLQANKNMLNLSEAATYLDNYNQDETETYLNALELYEQEKDNPIIGKILEQANAYSSQQEIQTDNSRLKRLLLPVLLLTLGIAVLAIVAFRPVMAAWDMFSLKQIPEPIHQTQLHVSPADTTVIRNSNLRVRVINPEPFVAHTLHFRPDDLWRTREMPEAELTFHQLDFSFDYYVTTKWGVSDTFRVEVFELPAVTGLRLRYDFPIHTGLPTETEEPSDGFVKALQNTRVKLDMEANNPIRYARIAFRSGITDTLTRTGRNAFTTSFVVTRNDSYKLLLEDILGNTSATAEKPVDMITDKKPEVAIAYPGRDTTLTQNLLTPLRFIASDDWGLKKLVLCYRVNDAEENAKTVLKSIPSNPLQTDYIFNLIGVNLIPGDRVTYWAEVTDNAPQRQIGISRSFVLRLPSIEEIYQEISQIEEQKQGDLKDQLKRAEELSEQFEEKRRELMRKDNIDWEDKKQLEEFTEQQKKLVEEAEQVANDYEELIRKLEKNEALSQETLEKMERIRELMEDIASEDMQEAIEKMQEALEKLDENTLKQAMENFKFSMEEYMEKLERTIDLLEDIKKEQALQKAAEIAEEMREMQENLNEKTEAGEQDNESLAAEQDRISEKLKSLEEQLAEAQSMMTDPEDSALQEQMEQFSQEMQESGLKEDMQESSNQLQQNQKAEAMEAQEQALSKMKSMSKSLKNMQQSMSGGMQANLGTVFEDAIQRLLFISKLHEELEFRYSGDPFEVMPNHLANLESIDLTIANLFVEPQVALFIHPKFSYDLQKTRAHYRLMLQEINDNRATNMIKYSGVIREGINLLIYDLYQSMQNMSSSMSSGGGMQSMMQMLQQMSQEQMAMNMLTQQMMQQMGQQGITSDLRGQMQRLAASEDQLAENLRRTLQNNPDAREQSGTLQKTLDELEQLSKEIRRNRIDNSTLKRQERILSRLLDAQNSINKREYSKKRKAETAPEQAWQIPETVTKEFDKLRREALLDEDSHNLPRAYLEIVREYLRKMNEKANQ
ncbi:MAG: hypothetical protein K8S56_06005 [Candidatus Cloacimonetes bacterium]|nr:hypothetical protein [Candidatus Cloacimonadota bacterium]